jgi:hypothetical protein
MKTNLHPVSRKAHLFLACGFLLAVVLAGCVPVSLNPFYAERDLVAEPRLAGDWYETENNDNRWRFESAPDGGYLLSLSGESDQAGLLVARPFKLDGQLLIDLSPNQDLLKPAKLDGLYALLSIPGHTVLRVQSLGDRLVLAIMDQDRFKAKLAHQKGVKFQDYHKDNVLLTGSTAEVQKLLRKCLKDATLWETNELVRPSAAATVPR